MDILDFKPSSRCFFMDLGITYYYLSRSGADAPTRSGTLNENYVYIDLLKRQEFPEEIAFETRGKAQKLLYLKGDTKGGVNGKVETLPIYLLERYQFD